MRFPHSLPIPAGVAAIARRLEESGYEAWCVGGAVRDNLLGHENKDFDLATAATPAEVRRLFRRTIPIGVEHGTVAVLDRYRRLHEVTTFRRDIVTDGRHAVVEFGTSLEEDLARRDFTINAIAYHPLKHEWRDPFNGGADLETGLVRAVGDPDRRFQEDYLRILRALRFAAKFGFRIDPATWSAARANVAGLRVLSAERVREEWFRGLATAQAPSGLLALWRDVGALEAWLPEVEAGEADARAVDRFPVPDPVLISAYLSRDPAQTLARLKCANADIERARRIAEHRGGRPDPGSPADLRRWMARAGPAVDDLVAIARAEGRGEDLANAVARVRAARSPLTVSELAVSGADLLAVGIPEGPHVGAVLRQLLELVLDDPARNTKARLLETAATLRVAASGAAEPGPAERRGRGK